MIELRSVTKRFLKKSGLKGLLPFYPKEQVTALNNLSFACESGEILGVLGPNGAGKTTMAKLILNLILPDEGEILIGGKRLSERRHDLRRKIGYVSCDERSFFWRLTGRRNLRFFLSLYDCRSEDHALSLARYLDLEESLDVPFGLYSTGMRKRLSIVRGLMNDPEIIIFDEATNGLDVMGVMKLKELLRCECARKTVLWMTHRLEEITELCTRVLMIKTGNLIFYGPVSSLRERYRMPASRVTISLRGDVERIGLEARRIFSLEQEAQHDSQYSFTVLNDGPYLYDRLLQLLRATNAELVRFDQAEMAMSDIYISIMRS